jgi:hypothetical protein
VECFYVSIGSITIFRGFDVLANRAPLFCIIVGGVSFGTIIKVLYWMY